MHLYLFTGLLAFLAPNPFVIARMLTFNLTAYCPMDVNKWCIQQRIYEADVFGDDDIHAGEFCAFRRNMTRIVQWEAGFFDGDGLFDDDYEFVSIIDHNCTDTGETRRITRYLTEFDGHKSQSNHKYIPDSGDDIIIEYKLGNIHNVGDQRKLVYE